MRHGRCCVCQGEVIVHFQDLLGYFKKARSLLRERGVMLNKEAHFASGRYFRPTAAGIVVGDIFEESGSYGLLHNELALVDLAGFALERTVPIPLRNYKKTLEAWQGNLRRSRDRLEELVGPSNIDDICAISGWAVGSSPGRG